jgi:thiol-disulfide isomerase/thioredoxin
MPFRLFHFVRAMSLCLLGSISTSALALEPGESAPVLSLAGSTAQQAVPVAGKLTYVDFWASWCGPCRKSFPWMNEMQRKYAAQGLAIVGVNLDQERSDADAFLQKTPAEFPIAFDPSGDAPTRYGVKGMPTSVLVGADGKVLPRNLIRRFSCTYDDGASRELVFQAELFPAMAANPYLTFPLLVTGPGTLVLTWEGDNGFAQTETLPLRVA